MASTTSPVVAIGASAGGLKALSEVLSSLSTDFPAAITVYNTCTPIILARWQVFSTTVQL
ncbi:hypothetical protein NIES1031_08940 [Chroogloeocystis siderophila 5.2 s.c.1]|uniref:CheB-type methylesterase domain-containing protein n=1 Tax=Chroogloeocystis siderophila 5.2 s.c.1 TaxID=247279 RepID=A0A1U7HUY9_9CHRO|nr:chemotaxis protein CheB [Chroogloeocystis siderophila]OKH27406.1 hypothetical protein NIES1031_08940 [Chroogloeocystis siderophila 5.2 s.c.1]